MLLAAVFVSSGSLLPSPTRVRPPTSGAPCHWVASCTCVGTTVTAPRLMLQSYLAGGRQRPCWGMQQQQHLGVVRQQEARLSRLWVHRYEAPSVEAECSVWRAQAGSMDCGLFRQLCVAVLGQAAVQPCWLANSVTVLCSHGGGANLALPGSFGSGSAVGAGRWGIP